MLIERKYTSPILGEFEGRQGLTMHLMFTFHIH